MIIRLMRKGFPRWSVDQCWKQSGFIDKNFRNRDLPSVGTARWLHSSPLVEIPVVKAKKNLDNSRFSFLERARHYGKCFYDLSKARLSLLVVVTGSAGYVLGSGQNINPEGLLYTSIGTMMAASSANAFNQIMEIRNDSLMKRTMNRPLPSGRISRSVALAWAIGMGVSGISLLAYKTNLLTAGLGLANIGLYTLVYTPLKQIHPINTWVGAVVGAIPPLMGWSAAAGQLDSGAWVLASVLYFWQLPHFMALSWLCKNDYKSGGYKMLSLLDTAGKKTALIAVRNSIYLFPVGFLAAYLGTTSSAFAYENLALTAAMMTSSVVFYLKPTPETARKTFRYSLLYLPLVMIAMLTHRIPNDAPETHKPELKAEQETIQKHKNGYTAGFNGELLQKDTPRAPVSFMSAAPFPFLPLPGPSSGR